MITSIRIHTCSIYFVLKFHCVKLIDLNGYLFFFIKSLHYRTYLSLPTYHILQVVDSHRSNTIYKQVGVVCLTV